MKNKFKKYLKESIIFIVVLTIVLNALSYYRSLDLNKNNLEENHFTLLDNSKYIVKKDKAILVHFWATWCPTCSFEASNIEALSKDYEVITIAVQSGSKKEIEKYSEENNLSFNVVNDEDAFYSRKFNIQAFPTSFIYDKNKVLKFTEVGYTTKAGLYSRMALSK